MDACSQAQYRDLLAALPLRRPLDPETHERARRYAYHFFFRRMVPLPLLRMNRNPATEIDLSVLAELDPGWWEGLDGGFEGKLGLETTRDSVGESELLQVGA